MYNILLAITCLALVVTQTFLASRISEHRGGLLNPEGLLVVATIGVFSFYMGYFAVKAAVGFM